MLIPLLVFDDLYSHDLPRLVVEALQGLAEATFAEEVDDFKAIVEVILKDDLIVTIFIVIS